MSIRLINLVFNSSYAKGSSGKGKNTSAKLLVMLCLARYADDNGGNCYPSQGTIANECGISREVVNRKIGELCRDGFLSFLSQPGQPFSCKLYFDHLPTCDSPSQVDQPTCDSPSQVDQPTCDGESQGCDSKQSQPVMENHRGVILNSQPVILNSQPVMENHITRHESSRIVNETSKEEKHKTAREPDDSFVHQLLDYRRRILEVNILPDEARELGAVEWIEQNNFTRDEAIACYEFCRSEEWRKYAVTWQSVKKVIADWKLKQPSVSPPQLSALTIIPVRDDLAAFHSQISLSHSRRATGGFKTKTDLSIEAGLRMIAQFEEEDRLAALETQRTIRGDGN